MVNRLDKHLGLIIGAGFLVIIFSAILIIGMVMNEEFPRSGKHVCVINITGTIYNSLPIVEELERTIEDDSVPVIVLRLNTPGGAVSAAQEIYETVKKVRQSGKKVLASMGTVAASGGYYIAAGCDTIVAMPSTVTGSIGVIVEIPEFSELFDKIGVDMMVVKSGIYKDMGSPTRKMTKEEKDLINKVILDMQEQFISSVCEGRGMKTEDVRPYADGRVFTGREAQKLGFVDILGTYHDALDIAGKISGLGKNPPVREALGNTLWDMMFDGMVRIVTAWVDMQVPRFMYRVAL